MFPDIFWFDAGLVISSISCNPLLSYVVLVVFYAAVYLKSDTLNLLAAFGGVCMALWLRETFSWKPYWNNNGALIIGHCAAYLVAFCSNKLVPFEWILEHYFSHLLFSSALLAWNFRFAHRFMVTGALYGVWSVWKDYESFTEFYRMYVLCLIPFVLLGINSLVRLVYPNQKKEIKQN